MPPLIDTHLHLIYPETFNYPWIADVPALKKPFTLEDYASLTQEAGIEAALFMEVDVAESDSAKEARYFTEQAESGKFSLTGVIAAARPENDGFEAHLDSIASDRLKGIRRVLHVVEDAISQGSTFRQNIRTLGQRGLPFDLCTLPAQQEIGRALVDACPNTQFVLDHCGNPNIGDLDAFSDWQQTVQQYAERENVCAKLSGMVASGTAGAIDIESVRPYLDATLEAFGPERVVWGSDWPVCTLTSSLPDWISIFRKWLGQFSQDEQNSIAQSNARRIYKI